MSQQLLDSLAKASNTTKKNISQLIDTFLKTDQPTVEISAQEQKTSQIFHRYTSDLSLNKARELSKDERSERLLVNHQFNYGEIKIRQLRAPKEQQIFYDLGSGTGKVVLAAALCYPFHKCAGIQLLESLYNFSKTLQMKIQQEKVELESQLTQIRQDFFFPIIQFVNGDFKQTKWTDGTIIFVSSTCYTKEVMNEIQKMCEDLQKGTILVTLTRKLENVQGLILKSSFEGVTSWGSSTVFLHVKQI